MPKHSNRRTVVPHPQGWQVRSSKAARASLITETKPEAVGRALEILRNLGGGELTVQDVDGRITDSDTVTPVDEPPPPLGADRSSK
jgi:hypothetical protein